MSSSVTIPRQLGFGQTSRTDVWWMQPLAVFIGFSAFIVYSTWAALQGTDMTVCYYWFGGGGANYLSPFYSPSLFGSVPHPGIFGVKPDWWPAFAPFSPAFFIMWIPAGFRFTCYYYRGAYYKAFWLDPVNCAVGEPRSSYLGEKYLPLILQNIHRYFLYLALVFIFILGRDAFDGLWFKDADGTAHFGLAVGSLVLIVNVILLGGYTLGCHSLRHLVGGFLDTFTKASACHSCYNAVSCLNKKHMLWAWMSLFWVGFTDVYIRLCAMGVWHDFRFFKNTISMPTNYESFEYDVLVIGAGGAGLRAAIEASAAGVTVGLICKSLLGKAHTVMAEGGMAAAMGNVDDRDNWKVHFADTMRGGQYVNNWRMAELHAKEAPTRVKELEAWGAVFDRTKEGKISQRNFGGHRYPRLAHVGDRTGLEMIRTLQDHGIHQGITVHMEWTVVRLLKDGNRVVGAFGYDRERGRFKVFKAKAVVIASGGLGRAFKITSNSWEGTGDGHSLAYHAGAELLDMEFIQFHPTGMIWPPSVQGILVTESVRGEGGVLRNKEGKRFMYDDIPDNYKPQTSTDPEEGWRYTQNDKNAKRPPELLTRDHVARCINREVKAGRGSPHGGVFLDISWIKEKIPNAPEHIKKKLPSMYHQFMQLANLDITKEPMEVGPTTHYVMGGVRVNGETQMSSVPGLFAAGECAAGLHGANRLGGNSLSDLLVFGKRAGEFAAKYAKENPTVTIGDAQIEEAAKEALAPYENGANAGGSAEGPYQIQHELQGMMQELVGIVRLEGEMKQALERLEALKVRASKAAVYGHREYNPGWHTALDLKHLLTVSEAIALSALDRQESRGGHFREDFPEKSPEAAKVNSVVWKDADGSMKLRREPIPPMPEELKAVIEEMSK